MNDQTRDFDACYADTACELDSDFDVQPVKTGVLPKGSFTTTPTFADLTTMRVGGEIANYIEVDNENDFINAIALTDAEKLP